MKNKLLLIIGVLLCFIFSCTKEENLSSEKQIIEFSIGILGPNASGKVDEVAKTITFEVPSGTDVTKLAPMIKISPYAKITPVIGEVKDFTNPVSYTVTAEDGTKQVYLVKVVVLKSEAKALLSFNLDGLTPSVAGVIDEVKKTVTLAVPYGTNVKELVPTITFSKSATVTPATGVKHDFTKPVTYTVTAEDNSKQNYVVSVVVAMNSENNITGFKLTGLAPEVVGTIDEVKKTVKLVVPFGTSVKSFAPEISLSANASVTPATGVMQDFTKPVTYTVTAENGYKKEYVVSVECGQNSSNSITEFKLAGLTPGVVGIIDEGDRKVTLTVPASTKITELVPSITLSANATVVPAAGEKQDFTKPVVYTVSAENGSKRVYTVVVNVAKSGDNSMLSFTLAGLNPNVEGVIDESHRTVVLSVPSTTSRVALVPTITVSNCASVIPATATAQDFSTPVTYTVTAENGTSKEYVVTVDVAKSSDKNITAFKFTSFSPEVVASIDQNERNIVAIVPFGTDVQALVPTISTTTGATVDPNTGIAANFSSPVVYTVTAPDNSKKPYNVKVVVGENTEAKIAGFMLDKLNPKVAGVINESAKTILLTVPYGTKVTSLVPAISVSEQATISPQSGVAVDFTNEVIYKVTSESGVEVPYTVKVAVQKFIPVITSVSSTSIVKGNDIILNGSFSSDAVTVALEGADGSVTTLTDVFIESASKISATIPVAVVDGSYKISVTVNGEKTTFASPISITDGKPKISSLTQTVLVAGIGELVITGTGLKKDGTTTNIIIGSYKDAKGKDKSVKGAVNADGTEVRAIVPTDVPVGATTVKIMLGFNNYSNLLNVEIKANNAPVPTVSSVSATSILAGDELVIDGTNFMGKGNTVKLVGAKTYTLDAVSESETSLRFSTVKVITPGNYDLIVTSNGKDVTYKDCKIVVTLKPAVIKSVSPTTLKSGETITITGENFNKDTFSQLFLYDKKDDRNEYNHKFTISSDFKTVTFQIGTLFGGMVVDIAPGKYLLDVKISEKTSVGTTYRSIYSTEIEIIK